MTGTKSMTLHAWRNRNQHWTPTHKQPRKTELNKDHDSSRKALA